MKNHIFITFITIIIFKKTKSLQQWWYKKKMILTIKYFTSEKK